MDIELLDGKVRLIQADARAIPLPDESVDCCVTSPPYWGLRDYGTAKWEGGDPDCDHKIPSNEHDPKQTGQDGNSSRTVRFNRESCYRCGAKRIDSQLGLEKTPEEYVQHMVEVFREVKRVLTDDGNLFLNLGDSYTGSGKGGNPESGTKQGTNKGSQTVGVLYGKPTTQQEAAVTNVTRNYTGLPPKNLVGIPWRVAFALQADGWILRNDIIWAKPNPMPESVRDRCTRSHEYIFHLTKSPRYWYDSDAIKEPAVTAPKSRNKKAEGYQADYPNGDRFSEGERVRGSSKTDKQGALGKRTYTGFNDRWDEKERREGLSRLEESPNVTGNRVGRDDGGRPCNSEGQQFRNKRDVWTVPSAPYKEAHFATFPPKLIEPCILAGCPVNGLVLDPFGGSGTTARVAIDNGRRAVLLDLNYEDKEGSYLEMAKRRILAPEKPEKKTKIVVPDETPTLLSYAQ